MKKTLALFAALTMIISCAGCKADEGSTTAEATAEVTEEVSDKTEKTAEAEDAADDNAAESETQQAESSDSTASATDNADDAENTDSSDNTENAADTNEADDTDEDVTTNVNGEDLLLIQLSEKMIEWDNNVIMSVYTDAEGLSTRIDINKLGEDMYMSMNMMDWIVMDMLIADGTSYIIDHENKCYSPSEEDAVVSFNTDDYLTENTEDYRSSGTETVNGVEYLYEEYEIDGTTARYYFDSDENIQLIGVFYEDSEPQYINFTVEFSDTADETPFVFPADYTEMTAEEYAELLYGDMFGDSETYEWDWDETYEWDWDETYEWDWDETYEWY